MSGPQEAAVTVGYVAAAGAPLATPSLANAASDAVDAVTVEFLVEWALLEPESQERIRMDERERRKKQEEKQNLEAEETKEAMPRSLFPSLDSSSSVGKRKGKRKLPRNSSRPRLVSGCCPRSTRARSSPHCLVLQWIQVPASVPEAFWDEFHTFLCDVGARAVRTWKPGLSTGHWYLAPTCSLPVTLEEHKKIWSFLGDDYAVLYDLSYMAVTCSAFAGGVQVCGLFWKMTSG